VTPVYKLSASSVTGRTNYGSMLAGNPAFEFPGDFQSIATVTVASGGSATVTFSSIPQTFTHLQVRAFHRAEDNVSGDFPSIRFNSDTGSNYTQHRLFGSGSSAGSAGASSAVNYGAFAYNVADGSFGANIFGPSIIDILDYTNTNKYKTVRSLAGADNNGGGFIGLNSFVWMSNSAITTISLQPNQNDFAEYSHFALYGIKEA
jgi:hypothetical protein